MIRSLTLMLLCIIALIGGAAISPPASWLAKIVEIQTKGQVILGDPSGSFWKGSAIIGKRDNQKNTSKAIFPGRLFWTMSPSVLIGKIAITISNDSILSQPLVLTGWWNSYQLQETRVNLPSEKLTVFGAPFNTIRPSGKLSLHWKDIIIIFGNSLPKIYGKMTLSLDNIVTELSSIRPLGSYVMSFVLNGDIGELELSTKNGALHLTGFGEIEGGQVKFSGYAKAVDKKKELRNLMNLLGQWKTVNGDEVVQLVF